VEQRAFSNRAVDPIASRFVGGDVESGQFGIDRDVGLDRLRGFVWQFPFGVRWDGGCRSPPGR
jgi:hypothetical protein